MPIVRLAQQDGGTWDVMLWLPYSERRSSRASDRSIQIKYFLFHSLAHRAFIACRYYVPYQVTF